MLEGLLQLLGSAFPTVDSGQIPSVLAALRAGGRDSTWFFSADRTDPDPWQGDIIDSIRITMTDETGQDVERTGPVLILSNTCDVQQSDTVLVAACMPAAEVLETGGVLDAPVRANQITNLFFIDAVAGLGDIVVDLSLVQTVSAAHLRAAISTGTFHLRTRFSQLGYYAFLMKLTVHLMRPETREVVRDPVHQGS